MRYTSAVEKVANWLVHSGIQNISDDPKKKGGINSWFDLNKKDYPYIYSEITGYGMTTLVFLHQLFQDELFLNQGILAGQWVLKNALDDTGGVKTRDYLSPDPEAANYSFESGQLYSFDSGIVLFGLLNIYKKNQDPAFLDAAIKIGNFLINQCQKSDGAMYAYYDRQKNNPVSEFKKWSTQSGSFHAKIAMGLYLLYEITTDHKYLKSVERLLDSSLQFQKPDGRFISFADHGGTHLHPHAYSCEGLLFVGLKMKNDKYLSAVRRGVEWALNHVRNDGTLNYIYDGEKFNNLERVDALSQVLRLGAYLEQKNMISHAYRDKLNNMASRLLAYQKTIDEQVGGFYYGFHDNGEKLNHINSWCTMFALQALSYYDFLSRGQDITIDYLI